MLNFMDLFFFLILDLGDNYVSQIPIGYRILDGWFQVCTFSGYILILGCIYAYSRLCGDEFTVASSSCTCQLYGYDVYLSVSRRY
jgi:hypothetical protein